jgi:hypothetical protein
MYSVTTLPHVITTAHHIISVEIFVRHVKNLVCKVSVNLLQKLILCLSNIKDINTIQ